MIYYLGIRFSKQTVACLSEYKDRNTIYLPAPKLGFHTTIVYSRKPFEYKLSALPIEEPYILSKLELFGTSLIIQLPILWLHEQHATCLSTGATTDFSQYRPHITLAEGVDSFPQNLPWFSGYIKITELFYLEW